MNPGMKLLQSLSLPGDPAKSNEDAFGHGEAAAVVIDGATPLGDGLMPGPSDAAWIAQFGARRLMAHLRDGEGARKALRAALAEAQKSFVALRRHEPEEMWQTPCASMMLAAANEKGLELLWFGDCAALLKQGDAPVTVIGETFDKRAAEAARAQAIAREKKLSPASGLSRPEFIGTLRATRNRINSGSYWLFSPDVRAASHVSRRMIKPAGGSTLLLASDGFLALASDYGAYSADSLMAAAQDKGLAALGEELRAIEAGDSGGDKFPRFKKSDDATALLLGLT
jgi:serine/threonine protein phosphatase PrpC